MTQPVTQVSDSDIYDDCIHLFCPVCWPIWDRAELALCGTALGYTASIEQASQSVECVVCRDLSGTCDRCGRRTVNNG